MDIDDSTVVEVTSGAAVPVVAESSVQADQQAANKSVCSVGGLGAVASSNDAP